MGGGRPFSTFSDKKTSPMYKLGQAVARIFDGSPVVKQAHSNRVIILRAGVSWGSKAI